MKKRTTVALDKNLVMHARLAVHEGAAHTLAGLIERGLRLVVAALERKRRKQFRVRPITLPAGRKRR
jgi:hypothetical protein